MKVRVHPDRPSANAAVAALPGAIYLHQHREGLGADEFRIVNPGRAAARIRARGVFTEKPLAVLTDRLGRPCVPVKATVAVDGNGMRTVTTDADGAAVDFDDGRGAWR